MKEASGEANMTIITIVLIGVVLAIGAVVVRSVLNNTKRSSCCTSIGGVMYNGGCHNSGNCTIVDGKATSCSDSAMVTTGTGAYATCINEH